MPIDPTRPDVVLVDCLGARGFWVQASRLVAGLCAARWINSSKEASVMDEFAIQGISREWGGRPDRSVRQGTHDEGPRAL